MPTQSIRKIREFFFPIERHELRVFAPGFFLYFCLSFVYNGLRPLKITLVTSASQAGAEIIPFLKVWGIMPGAIFFTYLFARLSARLTREQTFYVILAIFLTFHLSFATFVYPNLEALRLDTLAGLLETILPEGYRGFVVMLQNWHLSLFYVLCEVWSSAVMFVLFWGFINDVTKLEQAARFYPLYNLGGNLASTASGYMLVRLSGMSYQAFLPYGHSAEEQYAITIIYISVAVGLVGIGLYHALCRLPEHSEVSGGRYQVERKASEFTLGQGFGHLIRSRHLLYIAVLVVGYNLVFNLIDVLWSQKVKQLFMGDRMAMTAYMGQVTIGKGILSSLLVFAAHWLMRRCGWRFTTLITPVGILVTSLAFFPLLYLDEHPLLAGIFQEWFGASILAVAVGIGSIQNVVTRGTKYSLYDTAREMAYIPLNGPAKRMGKAVIDGIASRFGKSSGSIVFMALLPFATSLDSMIPFISLMVILVTIVWVYSIYQLDHSMNELQAKPKANKRLVGEEVASLAGPVQGESKKDVCLVNS